MPIYDHVISLNYQMIRYFNQRGPWLYFFDLERAHELLKKLKDDIMREDIFRMQIQGVDPMKISFYADYIRGLNRGKKEIKASLSKDEAVAYKSVFNSVLKGMRRGQ